MTLLDQSTLVVIARKGWHILRLSLAILGATMILVAFTPVLPWWASVLAGHWDEGKGKVLIVFGGDLTSPEILGITSYWRSVYAVFCWREGHYETLVLSGRGLAGPMRDFVIAYGIPREAIVTEDRSRDTHENALFTAELLRNDTRPKVLVTSDYHMFRASRALKKAGVEVSCLPFPDAQKRVKNPIERLSIFYLLTAETAAVVYYRFRGWI